MSTNKYFNKSPNIFLNKIIILNFHNVDQSGLDKASLSVVVSVSSGSCDNKFLGLKIPALIQVTIGRALLTRGREETCVPSPKECDVHVIA